MNKVILRLYLVSSKQVLEVIFDLRLSFTDNFKLLSEIVDLPKINLIYDVENDIELRRDIPLIEFKFPNFYLLDIF